MTHRNRGDVLSQRPPAALATEPVPAAEQLAELSALLARNRDLQRRVRRLVTAERQVATYLRRLEDETAAAAAHVADLEDQVRTLRTRSAQLRHAVAQWERLHARQTSAAHDLAGQWAAVHGSAWWPLISLCLRLEQALPSLMRGMIWVSRLVWATLRGRLPQLIAVRRRARLLLASGLFDVPWYVQTHPEVATARLPAVLYWLLHGWHLGHNPHPLFDVAYYLAQGPALPADSDPLTDYLTVGDAAGRAPHPLFDGAWYRAQTMARLPVLRGETALGHYLRSGALLRLDPHPLFDSRWYLAQWPHAAIANPLAHYLEHASLGLHSPHPLFDAAWYLARYPDVAASGQNPLIHFVCYGAAEGRDPNPLFDSAGYRRRYLGNAPDDPLRHYLATGAVTGCDPHPLFASRWYLEQNPDVAASGQNPLVHYLHQGGYEGRDPSPRFSTRAYLNCYPHLLAQRLNPLVHFLTHHGTATPETVCQPRREAASLPDTPEWALAAVLGRDHPLARLDGFHPSERFVRQSTPFRPRVLVIVPNYNHAPYLRQRLDSIYGQSYDQLRVLLLDDASDDGSRALLEEYAARYPAITRTLFNAERSGSVFGQWRRGLEQAADDEELIWIAESDDACDRDLLAHLVPFFMDEAVQLAYARSVFIDEQGQPAAFRCEDYLDELDANKWRHAYVASAHREVATALGRKNTIPNVSAVLLRKTDFGPLFDQVPWSELTICGDWLLYLYVIRGGKLAYTPATCNYYRLHRTNASTRTHRSPEYYREHGLVARMIAQWYAVPDETLQLHRRYVERFYRQNGNELEGRGIGFGLLYDDAAIAAAARARQPNLLLGIFGFATGGGEVFPIRLANALRARGYAVTLFNFAGAPFNPGVRAMLEPGIAVVERNPWFPGVAWLVEHFGIEIAHTHHAAVDQTLGVVKSRLATPLRLVVTMHGMYESMPPEVFQAMQEQIGAAVDVWVSLTDKNLLPFIHAGCYDPARFARIPNGLPAPCFTPLERATLGLPATAFVLCLASRAIAEKGWREAIAIVTQARALCGRDLHLLLLGDGAVYDELCQEGVPEYVHLLGFVPNTAAYFALADVGILPSTFKGESFPLTAIECLSVGRPFIASDIGEVRAMLTGDDGEVAGFLLDLSAGTIPIDDAARAVAALASDAALYARKAAIAREIAPRFALEQVLARYEALYRADFVPNEIVADIWQ